MKLSDFDAYRITKMQNIQLAKVHSDPWSDLPISKQEARKELSALHERLADLQQRFFVDRRKKLLFVLQGMDTSGKDGSRRHVFRGENASRVCFARLG